AKDIFGDALYSNVEPFVKAALAGEPQRFECELADVTGRPRHAIVNYIPDHHDGRIKGFFVTVTDIAERRAAEMSLFEEKARFRVILVSIRDGVITTDGEWHILYLNTTASTMLGCDEREAQGKILEYITQVHEPNTGEPADSLLQQVLESGQAPRYKVEQILHGRQGVRTHIENWAAPIRDEHGRPRAAVIVFHEIGRARQMASKMARLALHDALTGLPNRRMLNDLGRQAMDTARESGHKLGLLYLDLDGFKKVNDDHGHAVGDELLVAVARRLSGQLRNGDGLYRQGGDEFVVLMDSIREAGEAQRLAERLIACCQTPVMTSSGCFEVTVSIGISVFPDDGDELAELIQRADRGMYAAK